MTDFSDAFGAALGLVLGFDADLAEIVGLSLRVSFLAVAIATAVGLPVGAAIALYRFPGRAALLVAMNALMGLPPVVVGLIAFALTFFSGSSIFNKVLFAWAGLGAAFGPPMLLCLWWPGVTRNGVLAGMITGLTTVLLWDNLDVNAWLSDQVEGLRLYSLAPGFLLSLLMTWSVSAMTRRSDD